MPAGLNYVCRVIRFSYPQDDAVGGAVPSGTVLYPFLDIRIESKAPTTALVEQGVQTIALFDAMLFEGNVTIEHNDQIEVLLPAMGWFHGKKFRVIGIQRASSHPALDRNQIKLTLRRWEQSHANDLQ